MAQVHRYLYQIFSASDLGEEKITECVSDVDVRTNLVDNNYRFVVTAVDEYFVTLHTQMDGFPFSYVKINTTVEHLNACLTTRESCDGSSAVPSAVGACAPAPADSVASAASVAGGTLKNSAAALLSLFTMGWNAEGLGEKRRSPGS